MAFHMAASPTHGSDHLRGQTDPPARHLPRCPQLLMLFFHWVHSSPMSSSEILRRLPATLLRRLLPQITLAGGPHETIAVRAPYTGATIGRSEEHTSELQ